MTNNKVDNSEGNRKIMSEIKNPKINERIFLLCDQCFWTVTCLDKSYLDKTYSYSKKRGIELTFGIRKIKS